MRCGEQKELAVTLIPVQMMTDAIQRTGKVPGSWVRRVLSHCQKKGGSSGAEQ